MIDEKNGSQFVDYNNFPSLISITKSPIPPKPPTLLLTSRNLQVWYEELHGSGGPDPAGQALQHLHEPCPVPLHRPNADHDHVRVREQLKIKRLVHNL